MSAKVWARSDDGKIEYISLTNEYLEGSMEVMHKAFFIDENVAQAVELDKNPEAIKELDELSLWAMRDGVSIIALDTETGKVAGGAFNKIHIPAKPEDENYLENYELKCRTPSSQSLIRFMIDIAEECDLFEYCKVDCILEIMFMGVLSQYRGKGIARKLTEISIEVARRLGSGENVKKSLSEDVVPLGPPPKIVTALCTSYITQNIMKSLGFETAARMDFSRWNFNGKSYTERIGPGTTFTTIDYYKV